jgi:hypothetical protein
MKGSEDMRDIGSRLELFIDDWLIERMEGAELRLQHPVPQEVVMVYDTRGTLGRLAHPWEGNVSAMRSVFKDDDLYKMYYRGANWTDERGYSTHEVACYAESGDGIDWVRPELGLYEFESKGPAQDAACYRAENPKSRNNIVWGRRLEGAFWKAFKDPNPQAPPEGRYKAYGGMDKHGFFGLLSPDGIHWTRIEKPLIPDELNTDWDLSAFWSPVDKKYHAYLRYWDGGTGSHSVRDGYRSVRHMTSEDSIHWSRWEPIRYDGPPDEFVQIYDNIIQPYGRAPHILIGTPKRFTPERKKKADHPIPGLSDIGLLTSRDGINFRFWPEAFCRPGPDPLNWIERNLYPCTGMLQTGPGELSMYWLEHYRTHLPQVEPGAEGNRLRRGTLRLDGFVSVNAPYAGGEFTTKPLTFEGRELVLNYATSAMGGVRVEIQREDGTPIEAHSLEKCGDIFGDEIEHVVVWEGDEELKKLEGTPVRLRFVLKDADLYSLRFRP